MGVTKHDQILEYIETLPVGEKISVRGIAKDLVVSEGTAYRAIKEAENIGLVSTIQRVGTIRIEKKLKENIERLSFGEVSKIIEGDILAGRKGLDKILKKFIIGAMTEKNMLRYITSGSLMIVGDREGVQRLALENGAAVLLTGGFDVSEEILSLADEVEMPIIRTTYDTFTVATTINRAISDQMIKKDIMTVEDIQTPMERTVVMNVKDTLEDYQKISEKTGFTRFPVVNKSNRLVGIITSKDVVNKQATQPIEKLMTKDPRRAKNHMSVASIGHQMIWDGLEIIPVVKDDLTLTGIVSRRDVMKAMQLAQKQPQVSNTLSDQITDEVVEKEGKNPDDLPDFSFVVTPQMVNSMGTLSFGVLNQIISTVGQRAMRVKYHRNSVIEQMSLYYFKLIQIDSEIDLKPRIIEVGRRSAKIDVEVYIDNIIVAKAMIVCQLMEQA
ncbi:DRTGG domain-containing protein [Vagococcus carniphilus]|uniref:DRTGG domain-containing protein n=1 Tax=Vagococcus carniphilus TaxID=218144 RepID=A0AAW8UD56_9ENTE|nr:DRTGG domain-containing protein [Vagococcus carniphilus]MDT2813532.1 DRTGG domain-containing protein [Vagococcus carniphilus]MDT2829965.1 DRTGG domain-containing protein [Vagococcus carniphilus]MDT2834910.1 DRTGG domain-containing protein [Vagococcus carniphilus]MDT2838400.1 DRTGG domain-containing protein [Vagococcus carniphilus]MDT2850149.1 DRTGG domain-containing protein [Vagococcus carniphilus]